MHLVARSKDNGKMRRQQWQLQEKKRRQRLVIYAHGRLRWMLKMIWRISHVISVHTTPICVRMHVSPQFLFCVAPVNFFTSGKRPVSRHLTLDATETSAYIPISST